MATQNQIVKINKAKKLDFNFHALEFTQSKYEALSLIQDTFYNDSYKKSAFKGLGFDEVIVTHGSTSLRFLQVLKILSETFKEFNVRFKYGSTAYFSDKGVISQAGPESITLI